MVYTDVTYSAVRASLVACERKTDQKDTIHAITLHIEAKRRLLSMLATQGTKPDERPLEISFVDVANAYVNGVPRRNLHRFLPRVLGLGKKAVALRPRCVYGTQGAGQIGEGVYARVLVKL